MNSEERIRETPRIWWSLFSTIMNFRNTYRKWNFVKTSIIQIIEFEEPIIDHKIGAILFEKHIKKGKPHFYEEIKEKWRGYELCKSIIDNLKLLDDQETRDNLFLLRPTFLWEDQILNEIADYEINKEDQKTKNFFKRMANEFLSQMNVTTFYNNLMFNITFHRHRIQRDLEEIFEDNREQASLV